MVIHKVVIPFGFNRCKRHHFSIVLALPTIGTHPIYKTPVSLAISVAMQNGDWDKREWL